MKVKLLVGALVVLVIMNLAALGSFWFIHLRGSSGYQRDRPGREWRSHRSHIGKEERRRLFRTMKGFHEEVRPVKEQTRALEDDLISSMKKDPVPRAHIDSLLQQISQNRLEIARRATDRMIAMGDSLSPEERGHIMDALMRYRRGGFEGREGERRRSRD